VILTLWVALSTAGLVTFVLGHLLNFHGVAAIGAVVVMLVGGEVILGDLQIKDGERIERNYTEVNGTAVATEETVNNTYAQHSWTERFASDNAIGLGIMQLLVGVLLFYQQMQAIGEGQ
jgi:hypothetical protein